MSQPIADPISERAMSLDPTYLSYPKRGLGMDHGLYPANPMPTRKAIAWPDQKPVAVTVLVNLEWFPILPNDAPFRAPGHMQTPYPDYRHYNVPRTSSVTTSPPRMRRTLSMAPCFPGT